MICKTLEEYQPEKAITQRKCKIEFGPIKDFHFLVCWELQAVVARVSPAYPLQWYYAVFYISLQPVTLVFWAFTALVAVDALKKVYWQTWMIISKKVIDESVYLRSVPLQPTSLKQPACKIPPTFTSTFLFPPYNTYQKSNVTVCFGILLGMSSNVYLNIRIHTHLQYQTVTLH